MLIIGITGTLGAGKGTIVDYLVREKGFCHYSVRDYITKEITKRDLPVNRDSMVIVANDLREKNTPSYITDQLYEQAIQTGRNCIIESIRTPGEVESLRKKGNFYLFAVDAESKERYHRIILRNSVTDNVSFETFLENELREMNGNDPNKQNLHQCIQMADYVLNNDQSIELLHQQIEDILQSIDI